MELGQWRQAPPIQLTTSQLAVDESIKGPKMCHSFCNLKILVETPPRKLKPRPEHWLNWWR